MRIKWTEKKKGTGHEISGQIIKGNITISKMRSFALQKTAFCVVKGNLSWADMPPFARRSGAVG